MLSTDLPWDFFPKTGPMADPGWGVDPDDEYGRGWVYLIRTPDGETAIADADPKILVSAEHLAAILRKGYGKGYCRLVPPDPLTERSPWKVATSHNYFLGWILHIDGENRHLVYRVNAYQARTNSYELAWPD